MIPQGSMLVNTKFFEELHRRADSIQTCGELQAFTTETIESLNASLAAITAQMAMLAPILSLLQPPSANPAQIVTWITDFITAFLTPYVKPYATYAAQLPAMTAAIAQLTATLQAKASSIDSCSLSVPSITPPPALPPLPEGQ